MGTRTYVVGAAAVCLLLQLAGSGTAAPVYWAVWEEPAEESATLVGKITVPGLPEPVTVTYTGAYDFAYAAGTGSTYWDSEFRYADGPVGNAPWHKGIIGLRDPAFEGVHTLTFSQRVENPVLAVTSLGQIIRPVRYEFEEPFEIVSRGLLGFVEEPGNILRGQGGSGTILFDDTDEIDWSVNGSEWPHYNGFTVGIFGAGEESPEPPGPPLPPDPPLVPGPGVIPAPGAVLLVAIGTALVGYLRWRRAL